MTFATFCDDRVIRRRSVRIDVRDAAAHHASAAYLFQRGLSALDDGAVEALER